MSCSINTAVQGDNLNTGKPNNMEFGSSLKKKDNQAEISILKPHPFLLYGSTFKNIRTAVSGYLVVLSISESDMNFPQKSSCCRQ